MSRTGGRKDYDVHRPRPYGSPRHFFPGPFSYTHHAEGDTTFGKWRNRVPRKIKKWMRKELRLGRTGPGGPITKPDHPS